MQATDFRNDLRARADYFANPSIERQLSASSQLPLMSNVRRHNHMSLAMYDVFVSYTSADEAFARFVHKHLSDEGLATYLAPVSLTPGAQWSPKTLGALSNARWVLFLASKAACSSAFILQEVGAAIATKKELVPVVWDMPPSQLPGWASQYQALNLAGKSAAEVHQEILAIAARVKAKRAEGLVIAGLLLAGLIAFGSKG